MAPSYRFMLSCLLLRTVGAGHGDLLGDEQHVGKPQKPGDRRRLEGGVGNHLDPDYKRLQDGLVRAEEWEKLLSKRAGRTDQRDTPNKDSSPLDVKGCEVSASTVTCKMTDMAVIPTNFPSSITLISFELTGITTIPEGAFQNYPNLTNILFNGNFLTKIAKGAFRGLPKLEELDLGMNYMSDTAFTSEPYESLSSLEMLDLMGNSLTKLPIGLLQGAINLRKLNLYGNKIGQLPSELPFTLTRLSHFKIVLNPLQSIDAMLFYQMPNVEIISLKLNAISTVRNGATFMYRPLLNRLHIQVNPLKCDCHALWMLEAIEEKKPWAMNWTSDSPTCGSRLPDITELYPEDLTCDKPYIEPITPTYIAHMKSMSLILQARMTKGYPKSKWVFPNGKWTPGNDSVSETDHSVVTTLVRTDFEMTGTVPFTLMASNVAGDSNLTFWVDIPGGAGGGPPVYTATLLLLLICARIFTG